MAAPRLVAGLTIEDEDVTRLMAIARSRTQPASRVERARMLLAYRDDPSFFGVGRLPGVHHQTVQRCIGRAAAFGPLAALDGSARPGKTAAITAGAKAWLVPLACQKAKDLGYPHELWTARLLARHAREYGPAAGHECLAKLVQGTVCKIPGAHAIKPHKIRYYLERRDPEFEEKMTHVLCIYREAGILKEANAKEPSGAAAIISYDEKPGMQAIGLTAPDLPPETSVHAAFARDHEYKRHGTLSLLAGIDLVSGKAHALVKERHRSCEFIEFLTLLDSAYPALNRDRNYPRQPFRPHFEGNQSLAHYPTRGPLRIHLHPEAWLLAQSRRRLLFQAGALRAPAHPNRFQTRARGAYLGRHRGNQPAARRPYLVLQTGKSRLI